MTFFIRFTALRPFFALILILLTCLLSCRSGSSSSAGAVMQPEPLEEGVMDLAMGIGDIFRFNYGPRNRNAPQPAVRAAFRATIGCARGRFQIVSSHTSEGSPAVFSESNTYGAVLRVSRDRSSAMGDGDFDNATTAVAIKIQLDEDKEQDFIFQNHPIFFAKNAQEFFLAFARPEFLSTTDLARHERLTRLIENNPVESGVQKRIRTILDDMKKPVTDIFSHRFWSVTPYQFGSSAAKYALIPMKCSAPGQIKDSMDESVPENTPENQAYLNERFIDGLKQSDQCFMLEAQFFKDDKSTPIDDATVEWRDTKTAVIAYITLEKNSPDSVEDCETLRFTPWQTQNDLRPLGSINQVRQIIYDRFSACRELQNQGRNKDSVYVDSCLDKAKE